MPYASPYENTVILDDDALNQLVKLIKTYPIAGSGTGIKLVPFLEYGYQVIHDITADNFDNFTLYTLDNDEYILASKFDEDEQYYQKVKQGYDKLQIQNTLRFSSNPDTGILTITDESYQAGKTNYPGFEDGIQEIQVGDKLEFSTNGPSGMNPPNPDGSFVIIRNGHNDDPEVIEVKGLSGGQIHIQDNTEAYRYTGTSGTSGDPGTDQDNLTNLVGSITTNGGISAGRSIKGYKLYGAVFNDYAEYRQTDNVKPGQCVVECGDGRLEKSMFRLQAGASIVSDTFGFAIGETINAQTPIAVCGRVLAYPAEDKLVYTPGAAVCAAPGGKISLMSREEIRNWPDRIVGYVSEIPTYEYWGSDNIAVDGRIWIKIK